MLELGSIFIGKYKIERQLGAGGMGEVFAATHIDLADRVAIKVLNAEVAGRQEAVDRFLREAQASVRLKGEHVARVFDVGRTSDGAPYMVMEYLEGADLMTMFRQRGRMPAHEVVDYVLQTCEGMAEAHAQAIVHRDIKPANLFVSHRPDGSPVVKVLDFGISKALDRDLQLTSSQAMLGTPAYMSPEQLRASRDVDTRTDVWSLGVVMYELLSGHYPFMAESFGDLVIQVVTQPAARLAGDVPAGLAAAVARCLERAPAARFQTVSDLAAAIAPFASNHAAGAAAAARSAKIFSRTGVSGPRAMLASQPSPSDATTEMTSNGAVHAALSVSTSPRIGGARRAWIAAGFAAAVIAAISVVALTHTGASTVAGPPPEPARSIAIDAPSASDAATAAVVVAPADAAVAAVPIAPADAAVVQPTTSKHRPVATPHHPPAGSHPDAPDDPLGTRM